MGLTFLVKVFSNKQVVPNILKKVMEGAVQYGCSNLSLTNIFLVMICSGRSIHPAVASLEREGCE